MVADVMTQLVEALQSPIPPIDEQIAPQIERAFCRSGDPRLRAWIHRRYPPGGCPTCDTLQAKLSEHLAGIRAGLAAEIGGGQ